jgi:hypothetical protein
MKKLFLAALLISSAAFAEPKFNALSPSDPSYAAYQEALCNTAMVNAARFGRERHEMDVWGIHGYPIMTARDEESRQAYIENWVITTELRDQAQKSVDENCN